MTHKAIGFGLLAAALAAAAGNAIGQSYPIKPIRFIVPYAPGGPTDLLARILGQKLTEAWGQPVVVENRAGANGNIGAEAVARSAADGYTLFLGNTSILTINPHLYKKLSYDATRDFAPVSLVVAAPLVLVVHPSLPAHNVRQLIALAKSRPGQMNFASAGSAGIAHLAGELFKSMAGVDLVHIPYKGAGPAMIDVMGGQVALTFTSTVSTLQHVKAGKLRGLGVTSRKRSPMLPDIPAIAETVAGYEVNPWYGVLVPARTPAEIVGRLSAEISRIGKLPDVRDRLTADGGEVIAGTPAQFSEVIKSDFDKWAKVTRASGVRLD